jgi:hypothetical protein
MDAIIEPPLAPEEAVNHLQEAYPFVASESPMSRLHLQIYRRLRHAGKIEERVLLESRAQELGI